MTDNISLSTAEARPDYQWATQIPPVNHMPQPSDLTSAAEQMFFTGAPVAHIVQYEDELRLRRMRGSGRVSSVLARLKR